MQAGGRSGHDGPEAFSLRRLLVVVQVALSMVLIVGALLFGRTLWNLATVDLGFRQDGVIVSIIDLRHAGIAQDGLSEAFDQVVAGIRSVPGVRHAAAALIVPMARAQWNGRILVGGAPQDGMVNFNQVGDGYFAAMETPMLAGRAITREDRAGTPLVAVVNERFARRYFPNRSPIGETFQMEGPPGEPAPPYTVVGLTRDTKYLDVREEFSPIAYLSLAQETRLLPLLDVIVRSDVAAQSQTPALTRAILQAAPGAVVGYDTMAKSIREALITERLMATLSGFFGFLALLIATIGLYGVMSYMVTRRKAEIGIRLALGAGRSDVTGMIVRDGAWLVGLGILVGTGLALVAARSARTLLFGVAPQDPVTVLASVVLLAAVGVLATYVPARRAARLDANVALRDQ
jgi:predicted permease